MSKKDLSDPQPKPITFSYKDVVEALLKHKGIKNGVWRIYVEFGLGAANIAGPEGQLSPTAFIPVKKLGIIPTSDITDFSVDAKSLRTATSSTSRKKPQKPKKRSGG